MYFPDSFATVFVILVLAESIEVVLNSRIVVRMEWLVIVFPTTTTTKAIAFLMAVESIGKAVIRYLLLVLLLLVIGVLVP